MTTPALTVSIDRTSLSLAALVASGTNDATVLGVTGYSEPGAVPRVTYGPTSAYLHGDKPLAWSYQQGVLQLEIVARASTETAAQALYDALAAAITQWPSYAVTTVVNGVTKVWTCYPGSLVPAERTLVDLRNHDAAWAVSLPCYPVHA